ncbi:hypothetical protein SCB29_36005, partial [Paraburkholderia sp. SIMBA_055]
RNLPHTCAVLIAGGTMLGATSKRGLTHYHQCRRDYGLRHNLYSFHFFAPRPDAKKSLGAQFAPFKPNLHGTIAAKKAD